MNPDDNSTIFIELVKAAEELTNLMGIFNMIDYPISICDACDNLERLIEKAKEKS